MSIRKKGIRVLLLALTVAALNKGLLMVGVSSALIQGIRGVIRVCPRP